MRKSAQQKQRDYNDALKALDKYHFPITASTISVETGLSPQYVTKIMKFFVKKGLVIDTMIDNQPGRLVIYYERA